jgi:hypothetical protein
MNLFFRTVAAAALLAALGSSSVSAQEDAKAPSSEELLAQALDNYRSLKSYRDEVTCELHNAKEPSSDAAVSEGDHAQNSRQKVNLKIQCSYAAPHSFSLKMTSDIVAGHDVNIGPVNYSEEVRYDGVNLRFKIVHGWYYGHPHEPREVASVLGGIMLSIIAGTHPATRLAMDHDINLETYLSASELQNLQPPTREMRGDEPWWRLETRNEEGYTRIIFLGGEPLLLKEMNTIIYDSDNTNEAGEPAQKSFSLIKFNNIELNPEISPDIFGRPPDSGYLPLDFQADLEKHINNPEESPWAAKPESE